MKKILCLFLAFTLLACEDEEDLLNPVEEIGDLTIEDVRLGNQTFRKLSGTVNINYTLSSDTQWLLDGGVFVGDGAVLTIEAGTKIYSSFNERTSFLSVLRGGQINALGTVSSPILFTSIRKVTSIPQPGDWGGIIINGKAPVNLPGGEGEGEGNTGSYGGTVTGDNSGVLRYVIIEYGGKNLGTNNELNGLSLNGVGNGTTIEFVESLYGLDDGIEIFGGTVNLRYIVSLGNGDDSFDWTYGWSGYGQFWVAQQDAFDGDRGIEADNNEENPTAGPISNPTVTNITLVGADDGDADNIGIVLRHGTKASIHNALVTNFSSSGLMVDGPTSTDYINTGELTVTNCLIYQNNLLDQSSPNIVNADAFRDDISNQMVADLRLSGFIGVQTTDFDPQSIDSWFLSAPFIGAVPENNDWTNWINPLR